MDELVLEALGQEMLLDPRFDGDVDRWLDIDHPTTYDDLVIVDDI